MADTDLSFEKPVVIITDDEPLIREFLSALIEDIAMVEEASDGEELLARVDEIQPDLILLDVEMPGLSGYEVCERLKSEPVTAQTPVIFITGREDAQDEEHGLVIGGSDYVKKPISPGLVKARINNQLRLIRYQRELERLATTDQLTDLWNRRYMLEVATNELGRFKRYGHTFSVVMFDIDHFKKLNDTHGHAGGDIALRECARILKDTVRRQDTLSRFGGEEFCIILPDTDLAGARVMAEKIRARVEDIEIAFDDVMISFTISLGVTEAHADDATFDDILARADEALYAAKSGGRNRVEVCP